MPSANTNLWYAAEEMDPGTLSAINAQLSTPAFRAKVDALGWQDHARYMQQPYAGQRTRSKASRDAYDQDLTRLVLSELGETGLPNGYNVSPEGYVQFANRTPLLQQAYHAASPFLYQQTLASVTGGLPGMGNAAGSAAGPGVGVEWAGDINYPAGGGGGGSWWRQGVDVLGSDAASAVGKAVDWGVGLYGGRRADRVLAADKAAADVRYQDRLDLLATQRAEDLQLDVDREAAKQARWDAEQNQRQAIWDAREAQMEPYRAAGHQSLARVANLQTPTRTPYRSRFMA